LKSNRQDAKKIPNEIADEADGPGFDRRSVFLHRPLEADFIGVHRRFHFDF